MNLTAIKVFYFAWNYWSRPNQFLVSVFVSGRGQNVSVFVPSCLKRSNSKTLFGHSLTPK